FLLCINVNAKAQEFTITGRVTDQPTETTLPGVTVRVKETNKATTTNADGAFKLSAEAGQVLVFSYIGYASKEISVTAANAVMDVALQVGSTQLSEIVVTGALGIERPARELGGGAQIVNNESLNQGKTINPITGLTS